MQGNVTPLLPAQALSATLHGPLLNQLRAHPEGMKIHRLVTALKVEEGVALDLRTHDQMATFRLNFLVMNALFSLQQALLEEDYGLEISSLMVRIYPRAEGISSQALDRDANARLRDYYLDWNHLEQTSEADVRAMLDRFWKQYWSHDRAQESYATLGLQPDSDKAEVRQAFRRLAAIHHPDKGGEAAQFLLIREAYENLMRL